MKKLGNTFNSLESKAIRQTRINDKLKEKLSKTERDYKQVKNRRDELIQENKELEGKINTLEDIKELAKLHGIDDREIKTLLK